MAADWNAAPAISSLSMCGHSGQRRRLRIVRCNVDGRFGPRWREYCGIMRECVRSRRSLECHIGPRGVGEAIPSRGERLPVEKVVSMNGIEREGRRTKEG